MVTGQLPSSASFLRGVSDAKEGRAPFPAMPQKNDSYEDQMYYRGFVQQTRKLDSLKRISA
jgi:hypothetical protein